ncbi:protein kinase [Niveomyces insectorum RCEF 264]|uniref:Protein kinase n=1 Tax=Niveomyces insectorum RCEF 264 TaxID=1081102 RepID=A0A167MB07_9HYPO|nr:protein kinase [Niveomyces insectorum RCEF 264]
MSVFRFLQKRTFLAYARAMNTPAVASPQLLPSDEALEEECLPAYDPTHFYPATVGEVLHDKYRIITKLGFGRNSTVWLAAYEKKGWLSKRTKYVALKVCNANSREDDQAKNERDVYRRLAEERKRRRHKGIHFVSSLVEAFEVPNPASSGHGATKHICLAQELLREPLQLLQYRMPDGKLPAGLVKAYVKPLLYGLDYLHTQCHVIHTDLKPDNIMLTLESPAIVERFVQSVTTQHPASRKIPPDGRTIYRSQNNFGPLEVDKPGLLPVITDFGLARFGDVDETGIRSRREPIQAPAYHAPEVLLGTGWSYSADIWNLGVLCAVRKIWNMLEGRNLFQYLTGPTHTYDARRHMAEMVALLGPPPSRLLQRERASKDVEWDDVYVTAEGRPAKTARGYFGGPFFDVQDNFRFPKLVPSVTLEDSVPSLQGEDKHCFLDFVRQAVAWVPEERATAAELLKHPWLEIKL